MEAGTVERRAVPLRPAHAEHAAPVCGTRGTAHAEHAAPVCGTCGTAHAAHAAPVCGTRGTACAEHVAPFAEHTVPLARNTRRHSQNMRRHSRRTCSAIPAEHAAPVTRNHGTSLQMGATTLSFPLSPLPCVLWCFMCVFCGIPCAYTMFMFHNVQHICTVTSHMCITICIVPGRSICQHFPCIAAFHMYIPCVHVPQHPT